MKSMTRKKLLLTFLICLLTGLGIWSCRSLPVRAAEPNEENIAIDSAHFPDTNFRSFVTQFDRDKNGILSRAERAAVTSVNVSGKVWKLKASSLSLKGIQYFEALEELNCSYQSVYTLDVSNLTSLKKIDCTESKLEQINILHCTSLEELICRGTYLLRLNLSTNTALTKLDLDANEIASLDLSRCRDLKELYIGFNEELTHLNLSGCSALTHLDICCTKIKNLDLSSLSSLTSLICYNAGLTNLDLSSCTALKELICFGNPLKQLNLDNNTSLEILECYRCGLTELKADKLKNLKELSCGDNNLQKLDLGQLKFLEKLNCGNSGLTSLDLRQLKSLEKLYCSSNNLTSLDLKQCKKLTYIGMEGQDLKINYDKGKRRINLGDNFQKKYVSHLSSGIAENGYIRWDDQTSVPRLLSYYYDTGYKNNAMKVVIEIPQGSVSNITYKVTFDPNGAENLRQTSKIVTYYGQYGMLPVVRRNGYKFMGWYTKKTGGSNIISKKTVTIARDHTLYARFIKKGQYKVNFREMGGTNLNPKHIIVTYQKPYGSLPTVQQTGYRFVGWYTKARGGTKITEKSIVKSRGDHTLYAHWEKSPTCMVTFNENNGDKLADPDKSVTYKESYGSLPKARRKKYQFLGWYTKRNGGKKISENSIVATSRAHTLYAHWRKITKLNTASITSLTSKKSGYVKVVYKKVKNAAGYEITYSTNRKFKPYAKKSTTAVNKTIKGLRKGKTYYVKVRAFTTDSTGKRFYGNYSKYKKITVI